MLARVMLDMPKRFNLMLHLPWEAPFLSLFDRRTSVMLRRIVKGTDDLSPRKVLRTLTEACRAAQQADQMLGRMFEVARLFDTLAFTREQIETMPDGYRRALIVQRRRAKLRSL